MQGQEFIFTKEQEQFLIDNRHKYTIHQFKKIFKCSWYAVEKKTKELNLDIKIKKGWTSEEEEQLARLSTEDHYQEIANKLGRSKEAIYLKARKMGLTLIQDRKKWTKYDEEMLSDKWGTKPIEKIAKEMGRSVNSLRVKAIRMKLGSLIEGDLDIIRVAEIENYVGISRDTIMRLNEKGLLKLENRSITKKKSIYYTKIDELWEFLKNNQELWDSNKLEPYTLGIEPEWLKEKRKRDFKNPPILYQRWTEQERNLARRLLLNGHDYEQIAEQVKRTKDAVRIELNKMLLSYRLALFWKGKELTILQDLYPKAKTKELAAILGRTEKAVQAKAEELGVKKRRLVKK